MNTFQGGYRCANYCGRHLLNFFIVGARVEAELSSAIRRCLGKRRGFVGGGGGGWSGVWSGGAASRPSIATMEANSELSTLLDGPLTVTSAAARVLAAGIGRAPGRGSSGSIMSRFAHWSSSTTAVACLSAGEAAGPHRVSMSERRNPMIIASMFGGTWFSTRNHACASMLLRRAVPR